jgi:hypothetical protein
LDVDYAAPTPLWLNDGQAVITDLSPLRLPPSLTAALLAWQQQFDAHFAVDRWPHWDSKAAEEWHVAEGHRLFQALIRALPSTKIMLRVWALDSDLEEEDSAGVESPLAGVWIHEPDVSSGA